MLKKALLLPIVALAALAALPVLAACGGDDDDAAADAPTAAAATATSAPTAPTAKPAYPAQVTDLIGRTVEIKAKPKAVVALSPTAVELVYAAGGTVVGRSATVSYPEAAKQAKDVGSAYAPSFETILSLKPDLIVADSIIHTQPQLKKPLEELGVPVIFAGADSYQKVLDGLTLMGKVFDSAEVTKKAITDIEKALEDARASINARPATRQSTAVALIADRDRTLYAAKANSYAGDIMAKLGLANPAANQPDAGAFPGYTAVPPEKLVEYNPDLIIAITPAPAPAPRLSATLAQIPAFKGLKALMTNKVIEGDVELFLQAPGPRIGEAFKAVAKAAAAP